MGDLTSRLVARVGRKSNILLLLLLGVHTIFFQLQLPWLLLLLLLVLLLLPLLLLLLFLLLWSFNCRPPARHVRAGVPVSRVDRHCGRHGHNLHGHAHAGFWGLEGQPTSMSRVYFFKGVDSSQDAVL